LKIIDQKNNQSPLSVSPQGEKISNPVSSFQEGLRGMTQNLAQENKNTSPHSISPQREKISSLEGGLKEGDQVGKVFIIEAQYVEDIPEVAWNFYIGGYQPAQKWLKDGKERELQIDDIRHYLKIIVALTETVRLIKETDSVCNEW
jgi:hypothetical protein